MGFMSISPDQCRAARAILNMEQNALAAAASVSRGVIIDFEKGRRTPGTNNLAAIRAALETAGVIFIDQNGNGPGVRLRERQG
ncbi:helix-turn-helix transcriptional regulator [Ancylobacter sonchi]